MPRPEPSIEVLRIAIEEQRRVFDELSVDYQNAKVKVLTFLGAGVGLLTYLYSSPVGNLFIPDEIYGKIFYFVGLLLVISSLVCLLYALKSESWEVPTENKKLSKLKETDEKKYLLYVKKRYTASWETNIKAYNSKQRILNMVFLPLLIGAIILIVVKVFNPGG